jgi:WD40 repeat protein
MNTEKFKNNIINFVILPFLLASCSAVTPIAPTNTVPSITPLPTYTPVPTATPTPNRIRDFSLSPDGSKIAVYTNDGVFIYDTLTLEKTLFSSQTGYYDDCRTPSGAVAFTPDGTSIAIALIYPNNYVEVKDVVTGELLWKTYDIPVGYCINRVEFAPDGKTIFVQSISAPVSRCELPEENLELYSLDRTSTIFFESRIFQAKRCTPISGKLKFLDNGKFYLFLWTDANSRVYIGNSKSGQITDQYEYDIYKDGWVNDISQNGQALAISSFEKPTTILVDPISRKPLIAVPYTVKLLKDKEQFLVYDHNHPWKLWKDGGVACSYNFMADERYLKFSADGNFLAVSVSHTTIEIWKVSTCEKINTISVSE